MQGYWRIIRRNLLSPIVIAILLLAGALLFVRQYRDAWFISFVIIVNALIGITQEIRAKRALRKLELLSAPKALLVEGDQTREVMYTELHTGDIIRLKAGDELPADACLIQAKGLEVNESMLTGESLAIDKAKGDTVYAATAVVAGTADATVTAVGNDTKAGKIGSVLKRYQPRLTPLQRAIQRAITALTYGAIGLALLIFITYYLSGRDSVVILKTITSAAVTVVPEGLLLASSLLLAYGSVRLARARVLPQKLSAIEAMALLNVLCVDKTGTLTSEEAEVERIESYGDEPIDGYVGLIARETSGGNSTGVALIKCCKVPEQIEMIETLAFSSSRKLAGIRVQVSKKVRTFMMGAPEFVSVLAPLTSDQQNQIDEAAEKGLRVLLVAEFRDGVTPMKQLAAGSGTATGVVVLKNPLRIGVKKTISFLQKRGVSIRVISGDNPGTVSYVAGAAGILHADKVITGSQLDKLNKEDFDNAAGKHTVFARVQPEQKERLIAYFRRQGYFTGMVGDGVNDALALKKADLGIAMYAGAPASRRVADIILLDNSFTSLPIGMKLGNRIMQAIEVIATLFFHKIIYGVVLLASTIIVGASYPFAPRHITFMNIFLVTMPTLMWTLFPPTPRHRVNPAHFWRDTLQSVAPIAIITGLTVALTYWIMTAVYPARPAEVATMTVLTATFFGVYMVFLVGPMLRLRVNARARKARLLYLAAVIFVAVSSFGIGPLRNFFDFTRPEIWTLWPALGVIVLAAVTQWYLAKRAGQRFDNQLLADAA